MSRREVSPFYPSAVQRPFLNGANRGPMLALVLLTIYIPWFWRTIWSVALAIVLFSFSAYWLRRLVRRDPFIIDVKLRQLTMYWQSWYPARNKYTARLYKPVPKWRR